MNWRKKLFGDRAFYAMILGIAIPVMVQNGITNFVNLLDNIMVGQVGTEQMSGVAIVNQLLFVYNLCIFGGLSGAGIFTAQYFGQGDREGIRSTFRYKLWVGVIVTAAACALFLTAGDGLISLYLNESGDGGDLLATLESGRGYLGVMLIGLPAAMLTQVYASTLRECGETLLPMKAGITAVLVNLVFNWLLINGIWFFPRLGVVGAAIATVLSRFVELTIVAVWTHRHPTRNPWTEGLYRTVRVPADRVRAYFVKGFPLLVNEGLWAMAMATLTQCYSVRGLNVVAALNISNTISNLFNIVFLAMGTAISIVVGQKLGAGELKEARETDTRMLVFTVLASAGTALILFLVAPLFPRLYNTGEDVRALAARLIRVTAIFMPQAAFMNGAYFTLRSGGKTVITFLFDSVSVWAVSIPIAFCLSRFTSLSVVWIMVCVQMGDWFKCALGYHLVKKGVWMNTIVGESAD